MLVPKNWFVLLTGKYAFGISVLLPLAIVSSGLAQKASASENPYYARVNSFGVLAGYSWDSSPMLLGEADNRRLLNIGASYSRRLALNRRVNWQFDVEFLPVALESDPVEHESFVYTSTTTPKTFTDNFTAAITGACHSSSGSGSSPVYSFTYTITCGRQWTIGEAMSPVGFRWNFVPRRKLQPFIDGHGGYMYSTQSIPVQNAGSFNFTFDVGAGLELYRSKTRSFRLEYRYHHISNDNTAAANPGIDSGLLQVSWTFGR